MRYYMLNKPRGCITACSDARHATVMDLIPPCEREGLFPVGRLDKDTEGLLILTDDGAFCNTLNSPTSGKTKTYRFYALGECGEQELLRLESGVEISAIKNGLTAPAKARLLGNTTLRDIAHLFDKSESVRLFHTRRGNRTVCHVELTVTEGKKHQVKRMAQAVGLTVVYLERIAVCSLALDPSLPRGAYRPLTDDELSLLL